LWQASIMLAQAYDLRPAREKDIWDLKLMVIRSSGLS